MIKILNHSLAKDRITTLRNKHTNSIDFKKAVKDLATILACEVMRDLATEKVEIETPICKTIQEVITQKITIVPILRAGLGMLEPFLDLIPKASTGFVGMERDEKTAKARGYYFKIIKKSDLVIVIDPMLATGGSLIATIEEIKQQCQFKKLIFACIIGAPEGIAALKKVHPNVDIYLSAQDEKLNEKFYIVPGLGDAGDRYYET